MPLTICANNNVPRGAHTIDRGIPNLYDPASVSEGVVYQRVQKFFPLGSVCRGS